SPDWKTLVSAAGREVAVWDLETGRLLRKCGPCRNTQYPAFSPDGTQLAAFGPRLTLWHGPVDGSAPGRDYDFPPASNELNPAVWRRADRLVIYGSGGAMTFDPQTGREVVRRARGESEAFRTLFATPDGRLMTAIETNAAQELDPDTLKLIPGKL